MTLDESQSILKLSKYVNIIVSLVIENNGKYLMVKETKEDIKDLWNFPAGKVHINEDLIEAAKREALEETGFECEVTDLMNIYYFYWDDMPGLTIRFNFWGKTTSSEKKELASDVSDSEFFSFEEIEKFAYENKLRSKATHQQLSDIKEGKHLPLSSIKNPMSNNS